MINILRSIVYDSTLYFQNAAKTPERIADRFELELYISGEGSSCVDGLLYPHQKGRFLVGRPGMKRYSLNRFVCYSLHFTADKTIGAQLNALPVVFFVSDFDLYEHLFQEIIRLFDSEGPHSFLLKSKVYALLDLITKDADKKTQEKKAGVKIPPELLNRAIQFIDENFKRNISLEDIAKHIRFSTIYFHNAFTAYFGKTPHAYLTEKRLDTAKILLLTTDNPISEIIEACGFSSHSHFDYTFKKAFGITPSAYRKKKYLLI